MIKAIAIIYGICLLLTAITNMGLKGSCVVLLLLIIGLAIDNVGDHHGIQKRKDDSQNKG